MYLKKQANTFHPLKIQNFSNLLFSEVKNIKIYYIYKSNKSLLVIAQINHFFTDNKSFVNYTIKPTTRYQSVN